MLFSAVSTTAMTSLVVCSFNYCSPLFSFGSASQNKREKNGKE